MYEDEIVLNDLMSFANLFDSPAVPRTKSVLLLKEDKNDLVNLEAMTTSMVESIIWTSCQEP